MAPKKKPVDETPICDPAYVRRIDPDMTGSHGFSRLPDGFWDSLANRRSYLDWLGERLGFRCLDDWYEVTVYDFLRNKGIGLIHRCRVSPAAAVMASIPQRKWCEWKFTRVPPGFWEVAENRHRYLRHGWERNWGSANRGRLVSDSDR